MGIMNLHLLTFVENIIMITAICLLRCIFIYELKFKILDFRSKFDIKKDFEPIFIEMFGRHTAEHILYGN